EVVPLLGGMVVTSPALVARMHHWLNGIDTDPIATSPDAVPELTSPPNAGPAKDAMTQLSTDELCHEWCRTSLQLMRTTDPQATAMLAAGRAYLLDELERRNPVGLATWLESGPRAFSDPRRFISENGDAQGRRQ
ncbi:MAG: hypothetical protein ACRD2A_19865, partial [Vicinamibacterales bacterium]